LVQHRFQLRNLLCRNLEIIDDLGDELARIGFGLHRRATRKCHQKHSWEGARPAHARVAFFSGFPSDVPVASHSVSSRFPRQIPRRDEAFSKGFRRSFQGKPTTDVPDRNRAQPSERASARSPLPCLRSRSLARSCRRKRAQVVRESPPQLIPTTPIVYLGPPVLLRWGGTRAATRPFLSGRMPNPLSRNRNAQVISNSCSPSHNRCAG
jgi:hypothetical protein